MRIITLLAVLAASVWAQTTSTYDLNRLRKEKIGGATTLTTAGSVPKVTANGTLGESAIKDDGTTVTVTGRNVAIGDTVPDAQTALYGAGTVWANNRPYLRDWQAQVGKIVSATITAANIVYIGDSWTSQNNITNPLRYNLMASFGDAGVGYVQLDGQATPPQGASVTSAGTWTAATPSTTPGVNGNSTTSVDAATPASKVVTAAATTFVIHYIAKPDGGSFRWKVDTGGWNTVETAAGAAAFASASTGSHNAAVSHALTIEVVTTGAAGVTLLGVDCQRSDLGVRLHRIGVPGATVATFTDRDATMWQAAFAALQPNLAIIGFGVNEKVGDIPPATMAANISTLAARIRAAVPTCDILLVPPTDIGETNAYTMAQYVEAQRNLAAAQGWGYVEAYKNFGSYTSANARGLYTNSTHINSAGGALVASLIDSYLTGGLAIRLSKQPVYGYFALYNNTTGQNNVAIGSRALMLNTTGGAAVAVGSNALDANTTGVQSTAVGYNALTAATTGSNGTGVGYGALAAVTTGASNTGLGVNTGGTLTTGANNTILGATADVDAAAAAYRTVLGAGASGKVDNSVTLGRATDTTIMGAPAAAVDAALVNGQCSFHLTTDTNLQIRCKGSDGTVRNGNVTLAP